MWTTNEELGASLIAYTRKWNAPEGEVKAHLYNKMNEYTRDTSNKQKKRTQQWATKN